MSSLFEKLGGEGAVSAVVDKFYDLMLADQQINHFYKTVDIEKLRSSQKEFITMVTGGPSNYAGKDMKKAHCKLNISKKDFALTWDHLAQSLEFFKVDKGLISEVKEIFYSVE
jgi:hemoglobin